MITGSLLEDYLAYKTLTGLGSEVISLQQVIDMNAQPKRTETGNKYDDGKPPLSLLDRYALEQTAQVLAFGARKYDAHNWRGGIRYSRLSDAALRHLHAFIDGEDDDPESKLPHLAHAMCCVMFLLWTSRNRPDLDDRFASGTSAEPIQLELFEENDE